MTYMCIYTSICHVLDLYDIYTICLALDIYTIHLDI